MNLEINDDTHEPPVHYSMDTLFYPRHVIVIDGLARPDSVAIAAWKSISSTFHAGTAEIVKSSDFINTPNLGEGASLAVIIDSPENYANIIILCDRRRISNALVLSPDHREFCTTEDLKSMRRLAEILPNGLRLLGPCSYGFITPHHQLNITPLLPMPRAGNIACLSQSGALCTAVLDWSFRTGMGFSAMVSTGMMADVDWYDLITYFGDDPYTKSIVIYLESIDDARSFLSAAREVALNKPIILLKAGRSHAGQNQEDNQGDILFSAALQRVGVLRVRTLAELFYMANILSTQPLPRGPRLSIITNAIGPAIMATDSLLDSDGQLADISEETRTELAKLLPAESIHNPFDLMGDASAELYEQVAHLLARDKNSDGTLVILTPQPVAHPTDTARLVVEATRRTGKPVLASWMGGDRVASGQAILHEAGIPAFPYPDTPARLFALMWRQSRNLDAIYETPSVIADEDSHQPDSQTVSQLISDARNQNRLELPEWESLAILQAYGIPVAPVLAVATEEEAITAAEITGFPVALKLISPSHSLKHRVNGVRLNLRSPQDIHEGYRSIRSSLEEVGQAHNFQGVTVQKMARRQGLDLVVGSRIDKQFGPYLYIGAGGRISEILQEYVLGLPPLTTALAQRMIEKTRAWKIIRKFGQEDSRFLLQFQSLLVRLSHLIIQHPVIHEIEINPLLATPGSAIALDARISLFPIGATLPRPAIRPYPGQYTWQSVLRNHTQAIIRPVRPEDEPLIVEFHKKLSEETIYRRYMFQQKLSRRTSHERLRRTCFLDFDREIALAAVVDDPAEGKIVMGVGRIARNRSGESAEVAIVVADPYQSLGLGSTLLRHLVEIARKEEIHVLEGSMLPGNLHMQHLFTKMGFRLDNSRSDTVTARLAL